MTTSETWEVDRLAAAELLARLKEAPEGEWGTIAAEAIASMRLHNYDWAAQRVRQSMLATLEREADRTFRDRDASWSDGFVHAEKCLLATSTSDLLGVSSRPARSKGQVLRALLRSARRQKSVPTT